MLRRLLAVCLCGLLATLAFALPPEPPPPANYQVLLRYSIQAFRTERLLQYDEMNAALKKAGFVRAADDPVADDEPDNPAYTRIRGSVPAGGVAKLLSQRHVRCLAIYPAGTTLPDKGPLRVAVHLSNRHQPIYQRRLARQVARVLSEDVGFIEAVGYDSDGSTRLVGSLPRENLDKVIEDIRQLPTAAKQGSPLTDLSPVRLIVIRPDWPIVPGMPQPAEVPEPQRKFSPDLRALLAGAGDQPARLEVILGWVPRSDDSSWINILRVPGMEIEGRVGPLVSVLGIPKAIAPLLAQKDEVVAIRLPRSGRIRSVQQPPKAAADWSPLRASGAADLHALGRKGKGTRLALIADDFAGWQQLKGKVSLVDLTAERNRDLQPDPFPTKQGEGFGTRCARSLLQAAPEAELTLVRIDATAPYMLESVARFINGEPIRSVSLDNRQDDLREDRRRIELRRQEVTTERVRVLSLPISDDPELLKERAAYDKLQADFDRDEKIFVESRDRYLRLYRDLSALKGIRVVASTLVWTDGFPVDGSSSLSRFFDDRPFKAALWFQAVGDSGGQAWSGLFRDADDNGIMEFADLQSRLPQGAWSHELNFLEWQGKDKAIPAGAKLRLNLQWREAHDPVPLRQGDDVYREPLANLRLVVVYQPDPQGKARPADDLEVVAQSEGRPIRLNQLPNSATYEHTLDLDIKRAGRYAVFIMGKKPRSITAPGENALPALERSAELRVRLFATTLQGDGRATWATFSTPTAALGMPADARSVISVAAADRAGKPLVSSANGPPANMALLVKPDVLAYGDDTAQAASFAAGLAAAYWPVGGTLRGVLEQMRARPGQVLCVPARPLSASER
jgi:hypothetical protein